MNKIFLYMAILLVMPIIVSSQMTVYDLVNEIRANPKLYTFVISKSIDSQALQQADSLMEFLGLSKSNFDNRITHNNHLVIMGVSDKNTKIAENIGNKEVGPMLIATNNKNLIIAASNTKNLEKAVGIIKDYQQNADDLLVHYYPENKNLFSPLAGSGMLVLSVTAGILLAGGAFALLARPGKKQKAAGSSQIKDYIISNLRKGYTQDQIWQTLARAGWQEDVLRQLFDEINKN